MSNIQLIVDAGSTKTEWCVTGDSKVKKVVTKGISPFFLNTDQIVLLLQQELLPRLKNTAVNTIYYYGTGCSTPANIATIKKALQQVFGIKDIYVTHDMEGAARALCGHEKGIACILGTGANSCFYNGKKIVSNSPGLGYVLGDEGSGTYLGKKVIQYFLYNTFDEDLRARFQEVYKEDKASILQKVYREPLPNRYLASFAKFLADNRGHYMVENIIEDGLNDFFFTHLCKYREVWKYPVNFTGSIAFGFKDIIRDLCNTYNFELGTILKEPMKGLLAYHQQ